MLPIKTCREHCLPLKVTEIGKNNFKNPFVERYRLFPKNILKYDWLDSWMNLAGIIPLHSDLYAISLEFKPSEAGAKAKTLTL